MILKPFFGKKDVTKPKGLPVGTLSIMLSDDKNNTLSMSMTKASIFSIDT